MDRAPVRAVRQRTGDEFAMNMTAMKTEPATILVWGEGPATSTPFVAAEQMEKK